jgi:predicted HTH transcriptional regulator
VSHADSDPVNSANDTVNSSNDPVKLSNELVKSSNDTVNDTVFTLIKDNNNVTAIEISEQLNISLRTVRRRIKELKNGHKLERIGSDKTGSWKITE